MKEPAGKHFTQYPLVLISVAFSLGIITENALALNARLLIAGIFVLSAASYIFRRSSSATLFLFLAFVFLGAFCFFAGINGIRSDRIRMLIDSGAIVSGDPVEIEGRLSEPPEPTAEGFVMTEEMPVFQLN